MNKNIYYLSIQSTSLPHYFGKALILPSRFYKNRPTDIQNINSDYLVLSKNKFLNNSNCSIELVLDREEVDSLIKIENSSIFLYSKPIPISRIKQIYFIDEIQKLKTIDNINRGTAFVPEKIIKVIEEEKNSISIDNEEYNYNLELEAKIKTYNQVLGGISFVQYTYEGEYAKKYFSILSHFNNYIYDKHIEKQKVFTGYNGAFTSKGKVWDKLSPLIYEYISDDDVQRQAKEDNIVITKSLGLFNYEELENVNSLTYKLAILSTYGEDSRKRKKTNSLIFDCINGKIPQEKQEGIALIYGINNGYSSFRNQYDKKIVKFKMDSLLDYYVIESVFQYVINDKKDNGKFEYIDSLFPNEELVLDIEKSFDLEEYLVNITKYFKENIFNMSPKELLDNLISKFKKKFNEEMNKKDSELKNIRFKIAELNQEVVTKKNELQEQKIIVDQLNKDEAILNQKVEEKDNNISDLNKSIITLEDDKKELNKCISKKNIELESLNQNIDNKVQKINNLNKSIEDRNNELQRRQDTINQLNRNKDALNQELEEKNKNINSLKQEVKSKNNELEEQRSIIGKLNEDKDILNQKLAERDNKINDLNKSIDNKDKNINSLKQKVETKDNKVTFDKEKERIHIEQDLYKLRVKDLKGLAIEKGLKFKSRIKKQELIELLNKETNDGLI